MIQSHPVISFLLGTFVLSASAFLFMYFIPAAQSPEGMPGLPIWLLAVWSPSVMAIIVSASQGQLGELLVRLLQFRDLGVSWVIMAVPLLILLVALLLHWREVQLAQLTPGLLIMLLGFNLLLGPLGEELGWRGLLQPAMTTRFGWLMGTLIVAALWAVWHAPLWAIASPQSEIPFLVFAVHVLAYSLLMGAAQSLSPHSLVPAVLLHLLFNVTASIAVIAIIHNLLAVTV